MLVIGRINGECHPFPGESQSGAVLSLLREAEYTHTPRPSTPISVGMSDVLIVWARMFIIASLTTKGWR